MPKWPVALVIACMSVGSLHAVGTISSLDVSGLGNVLALSLQDDPAAGQRTTYEASVLIDGGTSPELVPRDLAYCHFVSSLATRTGDALRRRVELLAQDSLDLSAADREVIVSAIEYLRPQLLSIEEQRMVGFQIGRAPDPSLHMALREERQRELLVAAQQIRASLSVSGVNALDAYIDEQVRPRIVVYEVPPNMTK